ncbi:MAG TPA: pilus assembly protein N-terminal domain-containing protein [Rhizomicrobium sp.]|jgi:hypothetical protein|nr:pilus assembly protein N-terminal domain-containing protein [Rhizomicrobium sp.]
MKTATCCLLFAAILPVAAGAAAAPVCPVKPHHLVRVHKAVVHHAVVHHAAGGVGLVVDQARLVSFPEPVKTVYVGNPVIADVNMLDPQHAFLLGKTFGMTNIIALSADGKQVSNQQVTVLNNGAAVTVNRGPEQYNYMCTLSHCETAPRPGDPQTFVQTTEGVATTHESAAMTGAGAATSTTGQTASNQ